MHNSLRRDRSVLAAVGDGSGVTVERPSHAPVPSRWAAPTVTTAATSVTRTRHRGSGAKRNPRPSATSGCPSGRRRQFRSVARNFHYTGWRRVMSTSDASTFEVVGALSQAASLSRRAPRLSPPGSPAVVAREAVVVAVLVAALTALLAPRDLGAGAAPHPGWAGVILLSARYGSRGFGFALVSVCARCADRDRHGSPTRPVAGGRKQLASDLARWW